MNNYQLKYSKTQVFNTRFAVKDMMGQGGGGGSATTLKSSDNSVILNADPNGEIDIRRNNYICREEYDEENEEGFATFFLYFPMPSENDIPTNKSEQRIVLTTKDGRCVIVHFFLNDSLQPTVKTSGDINEDDWIDVLVIGHIDATIDDYDGVVFMVHLGSDTYVTYSSHGDITINENGRFYIQNDGDKQNANCPYSMEYMEEYLEEFELITSVNGSLKDFSSESEDETDIRKPIENKIFNVATSLLVLDPKCYNIVEMYTESNERSYQIKAESSDYYIDGMFVGYGGSNYVSTDLQILGTLPWYSLLNPIKDRSRAIPFFVVGNTMYVDNVKDTDVQYLTIEHNDYSEDTHYYYALNNVMMPMYDNSAPFVKGDVFFSSVCTLNGVGHISQVSGATERLANHVSYVELPSDLDVYAVELFEYYYTELETVVFHNNKFRNPQRDSYIYTESAYMFGGCTSLTSLDLEGCDTSEINSINHICNACTSLTSVSLKNCDLSNVTNSRNAFDGCTSLTEVDFSGCDLSNVTEYTNMFNDCGALQTIKAVGCNQATIDLLNQVKPQNATVVTTEQP